jgi:hypothetical protein
MHDENWGDHMGISYNMGMVRPYTLPAFHLVTLFLQRQSIVSSRYRADRKSPG